MVMNSIKDLDTCKMSENAQQPAAAKSSMQPSSQFSLPDPVSIIGKDRDFSKAMQMAPLTQSNVPIILAMLLLLLILIFSNLSNYTQKKLIIILNLYIHFIMK